MKNAARQSFQRVIARRSSGALSLVVRLVIISLFFVSSASNSFAQQPTSSPSANPLLARRAPHPLYWFWTREELKDEKFLRDLDEIRTRSTFNEVIISFRPYDDPAIGVTTDAVFHAVKRAAEYARERGINISIHLAHSGVEAAFGAAAPDERAELVFENHLKLDKDGRARFASQANDIKGYLPAALAGRARILRVYAYDASGADDDEHFDLATLVDITGKTIARQTARESLEVEIDAGRANANKRVYAMTLHQYVIPDMFSEHWARHFDRVLARYAEIGVKGADLDEFSFIPVRPQVNADGAGRWRERFYSSRMSVAYLEKTGRELARDLFLMRVAPAKDDAARITANNDYFELLRNRIAAVDEAFYRLTKQHLGADAFVSTHPTWRAGSSYEFWADYWYWWDVHRDIGQTDENENPSISWTLARKGREPFWIDMFYDKAASAYLQQAIFAARYGGRVDYHAVNDKSFGNDLGANDFYERIAPIEDEIRLLDYVQRALPDSRTLVIFGYPAYTNSYYPHQARDQFGMPQPFLNRYGDLLFRRGYLADIVPSYEIDDGDLRIDAEGRASYQGKTYDAVVFDQPQGSKPQTLDFLERLDTTKQKLTILGDCALDFAGRDIAARCQKIKARQSYDNDLYALLANVPRNNINDGCRLTDNSVLMFDDPARPYKATAEINGRRLSGTVRGGFLAHLDERENLDRIACGAAQTISLDEKPILVTDAPLDVAAERAGANWNIVTQSYQTRGGALLKIGDAELPALRSIVELRKSSVGANTLDVRIKLVSDKQSAGRSAFVQNVAFAVEQYPSKAVLEPLSNERSAIDEDAVIALKSFRLTLPKEAAAVSSARRFRFVTRIDAAVNGHRISLRTILSVPLGA